jgi:hypothetical protein
VIILVFNNEYAYIESGGPLGAESFEITLEQVTKIFIAAVEHISHALDITLLQ